MSLIDDLRFGLRTFVKRPLFSATVITVLGLGIGANSAIFSVVNAALFSSLHVRAQGELLNVYTTDSAGPRYGATSYPDYEYLRDNNRGAFSGVFGYSGLMTTITGNGEPEVLFGELVTGNYFSVSGAPLALGRGFAADEDRTPGIHPVVVIGHRLWQRRFNGDSSIIGSRVTLNGQSFTVIGVASPEFQGLLFRGLAADVWAPVMMMGQLRTDQLANRDERWMFVKGRLRNGVDESAASRIVSDVGAMLASAHPESNRGRTFATIPTSDVRIHPQGDVVALPGAVFLVVLVGFVLMIACTNIANVMLARATARRREIAMRLAIGATPRRIVRQLVTESAVLAIGSGVVGLIVASLVARLLIAFRPPLPVPISLDVSVDIRVVTFTALVSLVALVIFGLVPARRASRVSITASLANVGAAGPGTLRLRHALLVPQVALTLALLVVAGLFARSVSRASDVDPGFEPAGVAMVALNLRLDGYDEDRAHQFYADLTRRMRSMIDVHGVTLTDRIPLDLYGNQSTTIVLSTPQAAGPDTIPVQYASVDTGYFGAFGIRVRGRVFEEREHGASAGVVIVSEEAARRFWPGGNPVGQTVQVGVNGEVVQVVGVAGDVKVQSLGEAPQPFIYLPSDERKTGLLRFVVRTGSSVAATEVLRREVASLDADVAIFEARTMSQHLDVMLFPFRLAAGIGTTLGILGLVLAVVGLYGVVAYGVAHRTREFGIRMALGARSADVLRLVMGEGLRTVGLGVVIGAALSVGLGQLLSSVLFGISASDPVTMLGVPAVLVAVALIATFVPARRATTVQPAVALRDDG